MGKICSIAIIVFLSIYTKANSITTDIAGIVALNFFKTTQAPGANETALQATLVYSRGENDGTTDFFVFDITPGPGFVIVSGSDRAAPVLAYSGESNFSTGIPDIGLRGWLSHTAAGIHSKVLNPTAMANPLWASYISASAPSLRGDGLAPMLTTTWDQNPYYNNLCPYDNANHGRSVTGCVATAMAQIMKYWSFPSMGVGSYSYVDSQGAPGYSYNIGRLSADFGATAYSWGQMPARIDSTNTQIGTLLYDCGIAVGMNYSADGSSAYFYYPGHACALSAFISYFSYDAQTIKYVVKNSYTSQAWQALIQDELNQGRPVFYTGQDTGNIGGHAWVCDGYDANGTFHMNWGWGGMDNGYYSVTDLDAAPYNFSWTQGAIIGIQPDSAVRALSVANVLPEPAYRVFPNPAKDKINIEDNDAGSTYIIYDTRGRELAQGILHTGTTNIDIQNFKAGVYFLHITNGVRSSAKKIVVE
jgi:hypothetical protein